jgi:hypothetical protein
MKASMEVFYRQSAAQIAAAQIAQHASFVQTSPQTNMPAQPQSGWNDQGGDMDAENDHASGEEGRVLLPKKPVRRSHTSEKCIFHVRLHFA